MKSKILDYVGMNLDVFIVITSVLLLALIITLFYLLLDYLKIRKRYMEFMTGESGKSLEYTIYKRFREIDALNIGQKDNDDQIEIIYNKVRKSYSKVGLYKYDAFSVDNSPLGGSLSFVLTLLNSSNDGFMINTIHNRAGCHVYMKEIKDGKCNIVLAQEEQISLDMAIHFDDPVAEPQEEK